MSSYTVEFLVLHVNFAVLLCRTSCQLLSWQARVRVKNEKTIREEL